MVCRSNLRMKTSLKFGWTCREKLTRNLQQMVHARETEMQKAPKASAVTAALADASAWIDAQLEGANLYLLLLSPGSSIQSSFYRPK